MKYSKLFKKGKSIENKFLNLLLEQLCSQELNYVKKINFECEGSYHMRIKEIDATTKATSTNLLEGFGITIHDANKMSEIVIREEILQAFEISCFVEGDKLRVCEECCLPLKLVLHEIGHALDFHEREKYIYSIDDPTMFRFQDLITSYINIFVSEYFAEKYAVKKILKLNPNYKLEEYQSEFSEIENLINEHKNTYFSNRDLRKLANTLIVIGYQRILYPFSLRLGAESALLETCENNSEFWLTNFKIVNAIETAESSLPFLFFEYFQSEMQKFGFLIQTTEKGDILKFK